MELQDKTPSNDPPSTRDPGGRPESVLYARLRHLIGAQPAVFGFGIVMLLWFGITLPGLGSHGLWDPWEMDRAHVARQMTRPLRVLVVERRGDEGDLGPVSRWLDARYRDNLVVVTPDDGGPRRAATPASLLANATRALERDVFHLAFVDLSFIVRDPGSHAQVEELATWLEQARQHNPGTELVLVQPLPDPGSPNAADAAEWAETLRRTFADVRIELAGRELTGNTWGKQGAFRRELVKMLKQAQGGGYSPVAGLETAAPASYLERGFWKAAEKRKIEQRMTPAVPAAIAEALAGSPTFALREPLVLWPEGDVYDAILSDFQTGETTAPGEARQAVASLESVVDAHRFTPWTRAQFKRDGVTRSAPPLEHWLMALSFEQLGFSELASRLPSFLLGLLALLIAFRVTQHAFGPVAATFTGIVLVTSPLFFAQARSVAGTMSSTLALTLSAGGLLLAVHRGRSLHLPVWMVASGGFLGFLSQGLLGLIIPLVVAAAYLLVARGFRRPLLLPTGVLAAGLGIAWLAVTSGEGWTVWRHFDLQAPLFSWDLKETDRPIFLNFDRLIRQLGFGMAAWAALLPFGLALVALRVGRKDDAAEPAAPQAAFLLVALWFFVPYVVQSMALKETNHFVFPAVPAAAVAVALLLTRLMRGAGLGTLVGIAGAIIIGLLLSDAKKSPEPLTSFLTADPPLAGIKEDSDYPEALKLPSLLKLSLGAVALLLLLHAARLGSRVRRVVAFFTRPRAVAVTLTLLLVALAALLLAGLESQIAYAFTTRAGQTLEVIHRLYVRDVFYWRPHLWALYAALALSLVAYLAYHTPILRLGWGWARRWVLTSTVGRFAGVILALGALILGVMAHPRPSEAISEAASGAGALHLVVLAVGLALGLVISGLRRFARPRLEGLATRPGLAGLGEPLAGAAVVATAVALAAMGLGASALDALGEVQEAVEARPALLGLSALASTLLALPLAAGARGGGAALLIGISAVITGVLVALPGHDFGLLAAPLVIALGASSARIGGGLRRARGGVRGLLGRLGRDTARFYVVHAALAVGLALTALALLLVWGGFPDGFVTFATVQSPVFIAGLVALALLSAAIWAARRKEGAFPPTSLLHPLHRLADARTALTAGTVVALWLLIGLAAQLFAESGLRNVDFLALPEPRPPEATTARIQGYVVGDLMLAAALVVVNMLWGPMRRSARTCWAVMLGSGLAAATVMLVALAGKWMHLEAAVQGEDAVPFLGYLFAGSRRTLLLYGLIVLTAGLGLVTYLPALLERLRTRRALTEAGVSLALVAVVALGTGAAGAIPWAAAGAVAGVALIAAVALLMNRRAAQLRGLLQRVRAPDAAIMLGAIGLALVTAGLSGNLAAVLVPVLLAVVWFSPLARAGRSLERPGPLIVRGVAHLAGASLVAALPIWIAAALGLPDAWESSALLHVFLLLVLLGLAWAGSVAFRLGLGVADVIDRISPAGPAAVLFALLGLGELLRRAGAPTGTGVLLTALGALLLGATLLNLAARWTPPLRVAELVERPRVFVVALSLTVAGFAFFYNQKLVTAFSFHVSQKHILESVRTAEGGEPGPYQLLQHGLAGQSTRNFYTNDIPEVKDATVALQALLGRRDTVLPLTLSGSSATDYHVARGFAPENDADDDGVRDVPASAGIATAVDTEQRFLEDEARSWTPDAWAGALLFDSESWAFPIVRNTETRIDYDPEGAIAPPEVAARDQKRPGPVFDRFPSARNAYRVDWPKAPEHDATAMTGDRIYFLLPKVGSGSPGTQDRGSFSDLNHEFRKLSGGRHLPVLDDRSSRILLATSDLRPGEEDHNWIREAIISPEEFQQRAARGEVRGVNAQSPMAGMLTFDDSIRLLGWAMDSYAVSKGKKFELILYWESIKPVKTSYKVFVHADRAGHRIHTDHWILPVSEGKDGKHCIGCFQTDHWMPGDIVVDRYTREVPYGAPSGETDLWMGLFNPNGDSRVKVTSWNDEEVVYNGSDNRPKIGTFVVR